MSILDGGILIGGDTPTPDPRVLKGELLGSLTLSAGNYLFGTVLEGWVLNNPIDGRVYVTDDTLDAPTIWTDAVLVIPNQPLSDTQLGYIAEITQDNNKGTVIVYLFTPNTSLLEMYSPDEVVGVLLTFQRGHGFYLRAQADITLTETSPVYKVSIYIAEN